MGWFFKWVNKKLSEEQRKEENETEKVAETKSDDSSKNSLKNAVTFFIIVLGSLILNQLFANGSLAADNIQVPWLKEAIKSLMNFFGGTFALLPTIVMASALLSQTPALKNLVGFLLDGLIKLYVFGHKVFITLSGKVDSHDEQLKKQNQRLELVEKNQCEAKRMIKTLKEQHLKNEEKINSINNIMEQIASDPKAARDLRDTIMDVRHDVDHISTNMDKVLNILMNGGKNER